MKKYFKLISNINYYIFYLLYITTFIASIVESIKFRGFIQKHLFVNFDILISLTLISGILTIFLDFKLSQRKIWKYYYHGQLFVFPFLFLFWALLEYLNFVNYPNFVFTKFHIIPENLLIAIFLSFFLVAIEKIHAVQLKFKRRRSKVRSIKLLLPAMFIIVAFYLNAKTPLYALSEITKILDHPTATYAQKMGDKWGVDVYTYIDYIKEYTPKNSVILIPDRKDPWGLEGNDHLMRGFLYPRKVISYKEGMDLRKHHFDYALLAWGFYRGQVVEKDAYEFPYFNLPARQILVFDLFEKKVTLINGPYDYENKSYRGKYGLIKF